MYNSDKFVFIEDFDYLDIDSVYHIETSTGNQVKMLKAFPGDELSLKIEKDDTYNCYINDEIQKNSLEEAYVFSKKDFQLFRGHEGILKQFLFMSNRKIPEWFLVEEKKIKGLLWQKED